MSDQDWMRAKQIFTEALERNVPERRTFLGAACGEDAELRSKVEALLVAHDGAGEFLESPTGEGAQAAAREIANETNGDPQEAPGTQIGPYKILQLIGEGGFGVVYMADQVEPIRRRVALKVIKPGMDTREVIARFEAERQALAMMDHPNVAKVLDAGATNSGRPYFVMELVKGVPITEYCDANLLTTRERLELFVDVCKAVHHAHEKGIIHRDIKPSNVMVTLHDGVPFPKVIDFGIAKATNQPLTEKTLFTAYGQFLGTPAYMSPEQAAFSGLEIDRRSDIYSLGVLLYELLTGTTPLDQSSLRSHAFHEVMRIIREEDPPTPSARLRELGERLTAIATSRHVEPNALAKLLRGDLDWIVMRAIEKDRKRRYSSASELARDVSLYFRNEPVSARKPGVVYRLGKFAKRRRGRIIVGAGMMGAIVLGAIAARTWSSDSPSATAPPTRVPVTSSGDVSEPALTPDGGTIAYVQGSCAVLETCNELVAQDLSGGPAMPIARGASISQPKWHPAVGGSIMFQALRVLGAADTGGGAYLVRHQGGVPQRIGPVGAAAFNSSGDSVVLATQLKDDTIQLRFLRTADAEAFDSSSVLFLNGGVNDLDWSPDGKWLALLLYRGQGDRRVVLISRRTGTITDSLTVPGNRLVRWLPASDGVLLLLQGVGSDNVVFRHGVDGRTGRFAGDTATMLKLPKGGATFGVSRDLTMLAYSDRSSTTHEFTAMERDGDIVTARRLTSITGNNSPPVLSPDGSTVVLSRVDALGENLYVIPFEGGTLRPITSERDRLREPRWLRDERLVTKKGLPSNQLYVVNATGGQLRPFGPAGYTTGDPFYLQWLGDSLYALDQRDHHRVLVVDSNGAIRSEVTVPDSLDQLFAVTPDGRELWFFGPGDVHTGLLYYSLDRWTHEVKVAYALKRTGSGTFLGWAGGAFFGATWPRASEAGSPTVTRLNTDGTFKKVLVLPAVCNFRELSMSRDGRRFVCRRTDAKTDIWLMRDVNLAR